MAFLVYLGITVLWSDISLVSARRWVRLAGNLSMAAVLMTEPEPLESDFVESHIREGEHEESSSEGRRSPDNEAFDEPPEPSEAPEGWSTHDESSAPSEEILDDSYDTKDEIEVEMDDSEVSQPSEAATPLTEPPSPPPPPETEEDEEERRRRARRLFFGT